MWYCNANLSNYTYQSNNTNHAHKSNYSDYPYYSHRAIRGDGEGQAHQERWYSHRKDG